METRVHQDATTIDRLRKERDELRQAVGRLCSEHDVACNEGDQASKEHDYA